MIPPPKKNNQDLKHDPPAKWPTPVTKRPAPKGATGIVNTSK